LGAGDLAFLDEALQRGPEAYGWPVTVWSIRDLRELLRERRRVTVSVFTVHRAVWGLGYRYRRPRQLPPPAARSHTPAGRGRGRLGSGGAGVVGKRARAGRRTPGAFRLV
jgi:hypothetical protein